MKSNLFRLSTLGTTALLALFIALLGSMSVAWPIMVDATIFHFTAAQQSLGQIPYRDFRDINFPMIYWIHDLIVHLGGLGDFPFRLFDAIVALSIAGLAMFLTGGWRTSTSWLAALSFLFIHLSFGPLAEGQRDFILLLPLLTACALTVTNFRREQRHVALDVFAGGAIGVAALLKPTAGIFLVVPILIYGAWSMRAVLASIGGFASVIGVAVLGLSSTGALLPFLETLREYGAAYAAFDRKPLTDQLWTLMGWTIRLSGFALAVVLSLGKTWSAPARAFGALTVFGAFHYFFQGKAYFYHLYPFILGLVGWSCISLNNIRPKLATICLALISLFTLSRGVSAYRLSESFTPSVQLPVIVGGQIEAALRRHFAPGARVQMLDSDSGAFIAMARAGMRQATPDGYWFLLIGGKEEWRQDFVKRFTQEGPAGLLVTNSEWPKGLGFAAFDEWRELQEVVESEYRLAEQNTETTLAHPWAGRSPSAWRLYVKK